ncbi:acyltransferase [Nostoc sp. TCL240-02]|uniref:acyltransferase family protein n=1 Tax=Nostoc sp. TCL240-02 TaxID=2572090 RepID=UPI00157F834A|nr:acyltransferase [Nostoc sp. TCL240-02]QKQ72098.1 acyltransferase [Nostoc sp. TCL240-02]
MKKISTINGLRGISCLWVIISHCGIWGGYKGYNPNPKVAVDIFMMISGFLMMYTTEIVHTKQSFENKKNWINFYIRRFFRLSPAYYVELIVALLLADYFVRYYHELGSLNHNIWLANIPANFSMQNIILHITYIFGLQPKNAFSTMLPDWSLGLEMQFYLIFPPIFLFFKKANLNKLVIFLIATIFISILSKQYIIPYFTEPSLIFYQLPIFLIGIFIYCGTCDMSNRKRIISLILALLLCSYSIIIKDHRDDFYLLIAAILLAISFSNSVFSHKLNNLFDNIFFTILSDLSYSAYLFHGFFLSIIGAYIERNLYPLGYTSNQCVMMIIIAVIPLTYVTSYLSYKYIELPGIALGKALIKKF